MVVRRERPAEGRGCWRAMSPKGRHEIVVVGAGVFGAWISYALGARGRDVLLLDAYGPGNRRSSSGCESRVIRASFGGDLLYPSWAQQALAIWQRFAATNDRSLFHPTGVLE